MKGGFVLVFGLLILSIGVNSEYHSKSVNFGLEEKETHLHFYFHDTLSGDKPTAVLVAQPNKTVGEKSVGAFGSVFAIDDLLTEGPEITSKVIGNAQGTYVLTGQDKPSLVLSADFEFTTGEFNGSSISVFSRNPVTQTQREVAVVGGRGKFRFARGFAELKTYYLNYTTGDAIVEYNVIIRHY